MEEVGRAVEWIDDPAVRLVGTLDDALLLHEEAIAGPRLRQLLEEDLFRLLVGGGDEVARTLDRHLQVLDLAEIALQAAPGLDGGGGHDVHQGGVDHRGGLSRKGAARKRRGPPAVKNGQGSGAGVAALLTRPGAGVTSQSRRTA